MSLIEQDLYPGIDGEPASDERRSAIDGESVPGYDLRTTGSYEEYDDRVLTQDPTPRDEATLLQWYRRIGYTSYTYNKFAGWDIAEEVVQEATVRFMGRISHGGVPLLNGTFYAENYLDTIVERISTHLRSKRRLVEGRGGERVVSLDDMKLRGRSNTDWLDIDHGAFEQPEENVTRNEVDPTLTTAVSGLIKIYREALEDHLEGLSHKDVAEKRQIPVNTAATRRKRALDAIVKHLEQNEGDLSPEVAWHLRNYQLQKAAMPTAKRARQHTSVNPY
jgi:DNA-directed RNA polymerase specialized sigma24 family protein